MTQFCLLHKSTRRWGSRPQPWQPYPQVPPRMGPEENLLGPLAHECLGKTSIRPVQREPRGPPSLPLLDIPPRGTQASSWGSEWAREESLWHCPHVPLAFWCVHLSPGRGNPSPLQEGSKTQ